MKLKRFHHIVLVIFIIGCETVVDLVIPEEPPLLVVNSTLEGGGYIKLNVSESKHILDESDYVFVEGANVEIYREGILLEILPDSLEGNYISTVYKAEKGTNYAVKVSKNGYETASANVTVPLDTALIISVAMDTIPSEPGYYYPERLRFRVEIDDNKNSNYYEIVIYSGSYYLNYDFTVDPPVFIDSVYHLQPMFIESKDPGLEEYQSFGESIIFNDELFNGNVYTINILADLGFYYGVDEEDITPRDYYVVLRNTSKSYYQYDLSARLQYWIADNPFAQPVTVYSNIENGYGIFSGYNSVRFDVKD